MLMSGCALLARARGGLAVPAVNVYDLTSAQAAFQAAAVHRSPVIIAVAERYHAQAPFRVMAALCAALAAETAVDWALHLDHARQMDSLRRALDAGFTSVMLDASALPLAENIRRSAEAARIASAYGASLEVELGGLNDEMGQGETGALTDPDAAKRLMEGSGADMLAVAVGNRHGTYRGEPHLSLRLLERIHAATGGASLVLHGCSGLPTATLHAAAARGVRKLNVNTEMAEAGARAARMSGATRIDEMLPAVCAAMQASLDLYFGIDGEGATHE